MNHLRNRINQSAPEYFYRIRETVIEGMNEPKVVIEDFKGEDLNLCKIKAMTSYVDRLWHLTEPEEDQLISSPIQTDLPYRKDCIFSVSLYFVECRAEDNYIEHLLIDENDEEVIVSVKIEKDKLGFPI